MGFQHVLAMFGATVVAENTGHVKAVSALTGQNLSPYLGRAFIGSIPQGVLGGVTTVLFGLITVTGARIWVDNRVDFTRTVNLFVAAVTLVIGAADYTVTLGGFSLNGITLGTFGAIVLYQLFKGAPDTDGFAIVGDAAEAEAETRAGTADRPPR